MLTYTVSVRWYGCDIVVVFLLSQFSVLKSARYCLLLSVVDLLIANYAHMGKNSVSLVYPLLRFVTEFCGFVISRINFIFWRRADHESTALSLRMKCKKFLEIGLRRHERNSDYNLYLLFVFVCLCCRTKNN